MRSVHEWVTRTANSESLPCGVPVLSDTARLCQRFGPPLAALRLVLLALRFHFRERSFVVARAVVGVAVLPFAGRTDRHRIGLADEAWPPLLAVPAGRFVVGLLPVRPVAFERHGSADAAEARDQRGALVVVLHGN